MDIKLPYSRDGMMLHLDDTLDYEILESSIASMPKTNQSEDALVREAMAHPILHSCRSFPQADKM